MFSFWPQRHRATEKNDVFLFGHKDTEAGEKNRVFLCVSVSPWLISSVSSRPLCVVAWVRSTPAIANVLQRTHAFGYFLI